MIIVITEQGLKFEVWSLFKVQLLTSVLAELRMISAVVWITTFPSFSSVIHPYLSDWNCLKCAGVNLSVFSDFFPSVSCVPDA